MKPKVYVETTIISYLAGRQSRDLITAARQQLTIEWWQNRRDRYDLYLSPAVLNEIASGDPAAAARRLGFLAGLTPLNASPEVVRLAEAFVAAGALPKNATLDAYHIAYATVHYMDFLVTWNITHIANAALRAKIEQACRSEGLTLPVICTSEELSV